MTLQIEVIQLSSVLEHVERTATMIFVFSQACVQAGQMDKAMAQIFVTICDICQERNNALHDQNNMLNDIDAHIEH